jgi:cytochrome P450
MYTHVCVVQDVFGAALDTSTAVVQWAMAELVANPKVMEKAQSEIRHAMAGRARRVDEDALSHLHYLKAVIKEALRMHPPGPFFPRVCSDDREIQGYHVPKGTIALVNAWAIGRDPRYWEDPHEFKPERFEGGCCSFDYKGFDFEFIPFGAGRRMCPGLTFAHANIELALASLLYHFDWKMPCGVKPEELDMTEVAGFTVRRKYPLLLHPVQCISISE